MALRREWPRAQVLALLGEAPDFALAVVHFLARRLQHVTSLLEEVTLYTTRERAARYVLRRAAGEATRPLVQAEIASLIGTTREGVARALRALEAAGAIELRHGRVLVRDRPLLEQIAAGYRRGK
ncbi:MAG: Crp/Fnr family transcriptional regulator [Chloroflexi bacterium]|nr:Crp/Fnr family transcriptional regulator [Chloroflexota bacterium]